MIRPPATRCSLAAQTVVAPVVAKVVATAVVAIVAATATLPVAPASAKTMQVPGSRISLDLPVGFKPSPLFAGFMEIISSAGVLTQELPAEAYDKVRKGFTAEALATKGITKATPGKLARSKPYVFMTGEQSHPRAVFEKFILMFKDARNTAIVTFNVPKSSYAEGFIKRDDVLKALASARLEAAPAPSQDLFTLSHTGPFKLAGPPAGASRVYTDSADRSPKDKRNIVVVAPSLNQLPIKDTAEFSEYAIRQLENIADLEITGRSQRTVDGMDGYELVAKARRTPSGTDVIIRQLLLFPAKGGYFRLLAITKPADEARLAADLGKLFASFKTTGAGRSL